MKVSNNEANQLQFMQQQTSKKIKDTPNNQNLNLHALSYEKDSINQPTFMIQFNPEWDGMILALYKQLSCGVEAQKFLLEKYYADTFIGYTKRMLKSNDDDEAALIVIRVKYIGRNNKYMFQNIELNSIINGQGITNDYGDKIVQPIIQKIIELEKERDIIVLNVCNIKVFFKNLPPLEQATKQQIVKINSKIYEMDEDCNLKFVEEEEDDVPGFRNV